MAIGRYQRRRPRPPFHFRVAMPPRRSEAQEQLFATVAWGFMCHLPDQRDPRVEVSQWPCFGEHIEGDKYMANQFGIGKNASRVIFDCFIALDCQRWHRQ